MLAQAGELDVRDGDAAAEPGRAQALALQQRVEDLAGVEPGSLRRDRGQLLQRVLFARRLAAER